MGHWKNQLRQERIRQNWRQQDLADQLGTTVVTVQRWERGSHQPSAYFRIKLCALFGKSAEELGLVSDQMSSLETETLSHPSVGSGGTSHDVIPALDVPDESEPASPDSAPEDPLLNSAQIAQERTRLVHRRRVWLGFTWLAHLIFISLAVLLGLVLLGLSPVPLSLPLRDMVLHHPLPSFFVIGGVILFAGFCVWIFLRPALLRVELHRIAFDLQTFIQAMHASGMPHAGWWASHWKEA